MSASWLETNSDFHSYIASLPATQPVAIDTEFEWTKTYYPRLALLQLGVDQEHCALVDPFAITDWSPLHTLLTDASRPKIVFSGRNDLPILVRTCGGYQNCRPVAIQDLQLAMGFCGHPANFSLKATIETLFGIVLDKSETRSDWTQRPLTAQQLAYAAGDVTLLPEALRRVNEKLKNIGNDAFFLEETKLFGTSELYDEIDATQAWRRISGYWRIRGSARARERIRALAQWREETARANDLSRNRLLPDEALLRIALAETIAPLDLLRLPRVNKPTIKRFQNELLEIYANPIAPPEAPEPRNPLNTPAKKARFNQLIARVMGLIRQRAESRQIDATLLGARHDAEALVLQAMQKQPLTSRLLKGWRAQILQPTLAEVLEN